MGKKKSISAYSFKAAVPSHDTMITSVRLIMAGVEGERQTKREAELRMTNYLKRTAFSGTSPMT